MGDRHQRLSQDSAGLAHGGASRKPRNHERGPGSLRFAADAALTVRDYRAPWWLPGGNLQTIWPALHAKRSFGSLPQYRRERWATPDGDFVDVDWLAATPRGETLLVLFHGLEGSSRSHYAEAFADFCAERGIAFVIPHFRGCGGEINIGPRAYHSGDHE